MGLQAVAAGKHPGPLDAQYVHLGADLRGPLVGDAEDQRVGLAHAMMSDPEILILDEPTSGLDPNQISDVRDTMRRLGETKTLLLSTHILQEVEAMASRVILINEGRLVYDGPVADLAGNEGGLDGAFRKLTTAETAVA